MAIAEMTSIVGTPCKTGIFSVTALGEYTINLGFKPKQIAVFFQGASGSESNTQAGAIRLIYDERYSTSYSYRGIIASSTTVTAVALSGNNSGISEVNSSGFKFRNAGNGSNFYGTYYYFAIG